MLITMTEPDVSEKTQWILLKKLLDEPVGTKLGAFLKQNGYPHDATQKPWGKYYGQIRNKNQQVMGLMAEQRATYIDMQIRNSEVVNSSQIKELPTVNRLMLIDLLLTLPLDGKLKMINILKDLPSEEQIIVIKMILGL